MINAKRVTGVAIAVVVSAAVGVATVVARDDPNPPASTSGPMAQSQAKASQSAIDATKRRFSTFSEPGLAASPSAKILRDAERTYVGPGGRLDSVRLARRAKGQSIYFAEAPGRLCIIDELDSGVGGTTCVGANDLDKLANGQVVTTQRTDNGLRVFAPVPDGTKGCTATLKSGETVLVSVEGNVALADLPSSPKDFACDGASATALPDFDR